MDIDDVVEVYEIEGDRSGITENHARLDGYQGKIVMLDPGDSTALVELFKSKQRLWFRQRGLRYIRSKDKCICGGTIKDVPMFTSILKICSTCGRDPF